MTDKLDFKKTLDTYRAPRGRFEIIVVPDMQYVMVDGHGDPNTSSTFADALAALYPVAYKLKFGSKRELGRDYVVPPLEGLWWADDMGSFTGRLDKSRWDWTMMLMVPDWIDQDMFERAVARAGTKKAPTRLGDVRLQLLSEGRSAQTLHVGSFEDEAPVLARMHHEFIPENGLRPAGKHHEIYFSDFRAVPPDKLRTILRQPVESESASPR
ncbi:GyrI-like domain-containing protein [Microbacterium sp.]|uniref:GyrI-like domain-containing protein n=1 Tax=Microbacterium sp. TaxID=51671 RepID=UPI003C76B9B7